MNSEQSKGAEQAAETLREQWRKERAEYWTRLLDLKRQRDAERGAEQSFIYYAKDAVYRALEAVDKARAVLASPPTQEAGEPQEQLATSGEPGFEVPATMDWSGTTWLRDQRPSSVESLTAETWMETFADEHGRMPTLVEAWNAARATQPSAEPALTDEQIIEIARHHRTAGTWDSSLIAFARDCIAALTPTPKGDADE